MTDVRAPTQIDQWTATVYRGSFSFDFLIENSNFELVVFEHFQQVRLLHFQPLKWLLLFHNLLDQILHYFEITICNLRKNTIKTVTSSYVC